MGTVYTTAAAVRTKASSSGVTLRTDDDLSALTQALSDASTEVDGYCLLKYSAAALAASSWIEMKTRSIAVIKLCERRLNPIPQSAQLDFERAIKQLEQVSSGQLTIPDAGMRKGNIPVISNVRVRMTPVPHTDVEMGRSTGTPEGYVQFADPVEQFFDYTL